MNLFKKIPVSVLMFFMLLQGTKIDNNYANKILYSSGVKNPYFALYEPDEKFARIYYFGCLELQLCEPVKNREGNDIKVGVTRFREERRPGTMVLQIYAKERNDDEWVHIGTVGSSKELDIGKLKSANFIRFLYANPYDHLPPLDVVENAMGVDYVKDLK